MSHLAGTTLSVVSAWFTAVTQVGVKVFDSSLDLTSQPEPLYSAFQLYHDSRRIMIHAWIKTFHSSFDSTFNPEPGS